MGYKILKVQKFSGPLHSSFRLLDFDFQIKRKLHRHLRIDCKAIVIFLLSPDKKHLIAVVLERSNRTNRTNLAYAQDTSVWWLLTL